MALYRFGTRFDLFEFDSATGEVVKDGRCVRLRPQPARALAHLLERHGELVSREELQRAIWPEDTFVHFDHGLNSCLKQIRAALGGGSSPSHIETLVKRGFRLVAPLMIVAREGWTVPRFPGSHSLPAEAGSHDLISVASGFSRKARDEKRLKLEARDEKRLKLEARDEERLKPEARDERRLKPEATR